MKAFGGTDSDGEAFAKNFPSGFCIENPLEARCTVS
jgi:hypothetical protein